MHTDFLKTLELYKFFTYYLLTSWSSYCYRRHEYWQNNWRQLTVIAKIDEHFNTTLSLVDAVLHWIRTGADLTVINLGHWIAVFGVTRLLSWEVQK